MIVYSYTKDSLLNIQKANGSHPSKRNPSLSRNGFPNPITKWGWPLKYFLFQYVKKSFLTLMALSFQKH